MKMAKVFKHGNSQAVKLPEEFQFKGNEVEIFRRGDDIVLHEKKSNLKRAFELLCSMPIDYFSSVSEAGPPQNRDFF